MNILHCLLAKKVSNAYEYRSCYIQSLGINVSTRNNIGNGVKDDLHLTYQLVHIRWTRKTYMFCSSPCTLSTAISLGGSSFLLFIPFHLLAHNKYTIIMCKTAINFKVVFIFHTDKMSVKNIPACSDQNWILWGLVFQCILQFDERIYGYLLILYKIKHNIRREFWIFIFIE